MIHDITGQRFGRLSVLKFNQRKIRSYYWECICDCGNRKIANAATLKNGKLKSCGCLQKEKKHDLSNKKFGRLTTIEKTASGKHTYYLCKCDCGAIKEIRSDGLVSGKVISCGCWKKESFQKNTTTHGMSNINKRLHMCWCQILQRCKNPKNGNYKYYGARGITVCNEWMEYKVFYEWALQNGYKDTLSIDRIDVNGNYEPSNCRWATDTQQARNKTNNLYLTVNGETKTLSE